MPGRKYDNGSEYRYGFNGKEKDNSTGEGNLDFGERIYDGRLGKWLSTDPLQIKYPDLSPYNFVGNNPIRFIEFDGRDFGVKIDHDKKTIVIVANYHTGSQKSYEQALKAVKVWNAKSTTVDGYTVSVKLEVLKPPIVSDEEVLKNYSSLSKGSIITDELRDATSITKSLSLASKDPIGNTYRNGIEENSNKQQKGSEFEGGLTRAGRRVSMHFHKELGDLGEKTNAVGHEFGHTLGLKDPPDGNVNQSGDGYSPGGIMEYKATLDDMLDPSEQDIKNIISYAKESLNKKKQNPDRAKVKLLEVKGTATKKNPLGAAAKKTTPTVVNN